MKRHISSIGRDCAEAQARLAITTRARPDTMTGLRPVRSEIRPETSGATARLSRKALMGRRTSDGLAPRVAPVAASAGRLMSMPEYGTAARKPSNRVKAIDAG